MKSFITKILFLSLLLGTMLSCNKDEFLKEEPLDFLSPDNALENVSDFESALVDLYAKKRDMDYGISDESFSLLFGTDILTHARGISDLTAPKFSSLVVSLTPTGLVPAYYWERNFKIVSGANVIISRMPASKLTDAEKLLIGAEAKFFRAIAYRELVYLFGNVPLITEEITSVRNDLTQATKQQVLEQMVADFKDGATNLPAINKVKDGKVSNIVASHYLAETYIALGKYDEAVTAATTVISDPNVALMKARYGKRTSVAGKDVFWDLFQRGNVNRAGGNKEALWVCQMEEDVPGGGLASTKKTINYLERFHVPNVYGLTDTKGKAGFQGPKSNDNVGGRGVAFLRGTKLLEVDVWPAGYTGDMRCNDNNFIKDAIYDNPASVDFGKSVRANPGVNWKAQDWRFYSWFIKATTPGDHPTNMLLSNGLLNGDAGGTQRDMYYLRLSESYLLRAEAYLGKGSKDLAADDINEVRGRALATPVAAADVTLDYILDERARELALEEQRSITLRRVGKYVERVIKYNPLTGASALPQHELWPIPLKDIEANINGHLVQNTGY